MYFLFKRLFKINVSLKTSVLIFFSMRVGPVRITIYNERAVAQAEIRKNSANSPLSHQKPNEFMNSKACKPSPSPPPQKKTLQAPHSHITDKKLLR